MKKGEHAVVWAEIPVLNFDRAKEFYSKILDFEMQEQMMGKYRMEFLPMNSGSKGVGGAIIQGHEFTPSALGPSVYLFRTLTYAGSKVAPLQW